MKNESNLQLHNKESKMLAQAKQAVLELYKWQTADQIAESIATSVANAIIKHID